MADFALGSLKPRGTRRVVYCSDPSNTTRFMTEGRATPDDLRGVVRNYAGAQAIDTVVQEVFSQGWSHWWRGESCEWDARPHHQRLVPMMDDGVMPIQVYAEECHRHGIEMIAGFRMNDRHGHNADWFARLGQDKPHWILKGYAPSSKRTTDPRSYELGCALNYAEEEVRDFLFAVMEEVATRFDVDGIEFNFTRLPACFPLGEAEQSHAILTGFVRRVRAMLDAVGGRRGRRLLLGRARPAAPGRVPADGVRHPVLDRRPADRLRRPRRHRLHRSQSPVRGVRAAGPRHGRPRYRLLRVSAGAGVAGLRPPRPDADARALLRDGAQLLRRGRRRILHPERLRRLAASRCCGRCATRNGSPRTTATTPSIRSGGRTPAGGRDTRATSPTARKRSSCRGTRRAARGRIRFRLCEHLPEDSRAELLCRPAIVPGDEIEIRSSTASAFAPESVRCEWPDS